MKNIVIIFCFLFSISISISTDAQVKSSRIYGTGGTTGAVPLSDVYGNFSYSAQSSNRVLASPSSGTGIVSLRLLVAGDIPSLDAAKITTGIFGTSLLGTGTANSTNFLRGDGTYSNALTGQLILTSTTEQIRTRYDASNYLSTTVASNGSTTFDLTGTSPLFSFGKGTSFTAGIAANNTGFNLSIVSINGGTSTTTSQYLFGGASTINYRVGIRGSGANTLAAGSSGTNFIVADNGITTASSGTHAIISGATIIAPTITSGGASTVTDAAALYVKNATTGATNNYAGLIGSGNFKVSDTTITTGLRISGTGKFTRGFPGIGKIIVDTTGSGDWAWQAPAISTLATVTSTVNGNNTSQLIQVKGKSGNTLPGSALEISIDTSNQFADIQSLSRPGITPLPLRIQNVVGTYAAPAITAIGSQGGSITSFNTDANAADSGRTVLLIGGSEGHRIRPTSVTTSLTNSDHTIIVDNTGSINIVLPTANSCYFNGGTQVGREYTIVKKSSSSGNNVVIIPIAGNTISGQSTLILSTQYSSVTIQSDGTNWYILSSNVGGASL